MTIRIVTSYRTDLNYFTLLIDNEDFHNSESIADIFNLNVDTFNKLLIEKVIKHSYYTISKHHKDFEFSLCGKSKEIYIKCFKEAFAEQLILFILDENSDSL